MGAVGTRFEPQAADETDNRSQPGDVCTPWIGERPSLAYHAAFDLCASEANHTVGSVVVFASSPFYAREVVRRLGQEVTLCFTDEAGTSRTENRSMLGPEIDWDKVRLVTLETVDKEPSASTVIWTEPQRETWRAVAGHLSTLTPSATTICVLGTTRLRRILPEWRRSLAFPLMYEPLGSIRYIARVLQSLGHSTDGMYGFHGLFSLTLGVLSHLLAILRRGDLVDRCQAAMRQTYVVRGWQANWAPVWVLVGKYDGSSDGTCCDE